MLEMSELGGNPERSNRIVEPEYTESDTDIEYSLRPKVLDEYIGQDKVKENMKVYIEAAKKRGECLDHVLLYGPPGLGKTTLSCSSTRYTAFPVRLRKCFTLRWRTMFSI